MIKKLIPQPFYNISKINVLEDGSIQSNSISIPINNYAIEDFFFWDISKIKCLVDVSEPAKLFFDNSSEYFDLNPGLTEFPLYLTNNASIKLIKITSSCKDLIINRLEISDQGFSIPSNLPKISFVYEPVDKNVFRRGEQNTNIVKFVKNIQDSDIVYVRPVSQLVTDDYFKSISDILGQIPNHIKVINHIKNFYNHDCKDNTLDIWKNLGLPIPIFKVVNSLEESQEFVREHGRSYLRLNNSWGGRDTRIVYKPEQCSEFTIPKDRSQTRTIITKAVPYSFDDVMNVGRSYVVNGNIINSHCFVSKFTNDSNSILGTSVDFNTFIRANLYAQKCVNNYKQEIVMSVISLGLDVGCVDYIIDKDNKPIFLEVNANFGMGVGLNPYPYSTIIREELINNYDALVGLIPNVYFRMNENLFWDSLYTSLLI